MKPEVLRKMVTDSRSLSPPLISRDKSNVSEMEILYNRIDQQVFQPCVVYFLICLSWHCFFFFFIGYFKLVRFCCGVDGHQLLICRMGNGAMACSWAREECQN